MSLLNCLILLGVFACSVNCETLPRGVSRAKGSFYKPGSQFTCLDGSVTIPFDHINDDYCDCPDGSDEPGTSACRNGKFYCMNKGYKPETIPSSRVSDGVCDCCDGSDEYDAKVTCENTCIEMGKSMREELAAQRLLVEEGHRIRSTYTAQGKEAKAEKQALLVSLGPKRDELRARKEELEVKKNVAEEPEKEAKEAHEALWKEQLAVKEAEKDKARAAEAFTMLDTNTDNFVTVTELQARLELDTNGDGTVSEEEITIRIGEAVDVADFDLFLSTVWPKVKDTIKFPEPEVPEPIESPPTDTTPPPEAANEDDDDADFEEDDFEEDDDSGEESSDHASDNLMPAYPDETRQLIEVADAARKEFSQAEAEYNDADKEIQDIEKFLALNLGPDDVFYPLRGECYEFTDREYTYKFCPFEKATQRPKDGGSETNLGTFSSWAANGDDEYGYMKFEKGVHCWNGPDRSANVKFICGKENVLSNAAEPNRCEYTFDFTTPAACHVAPDEEEGAHLHTEL